MIKKTRPFKQYLLSAALFWLALAFILFLLNSLKTSSLPNLETLLSVGAVLLIVVPLLGGLFYLQERVGGRSKQKALDRSPFTDFLANGFEREDGAIAGIIKGYTVILSYEWVSPQRFEIKVLFDPTYLNGEYTQTELEQIFNTKPKSIWLGRIFFWGKCFMVCQMSSFLGFPKYEKVNEKIDFMIDVLQKGNLKPVSLEFYKEHFPINLYD
ncbi:MAG: hypothetical protein ACXVJN_23745 [Mucilaginibacter sp.]